MAEGKVRNDSKSTKNDKKNLKKTNKKKSDNKIFPDFRKSDGPPSATCSSRTKKNGPSDFGRTGSTATSTCEQDTSVICT